MSTKRATLITLYGKKNENVKILADWNENIHYSIAYATKLAIAVRVLYIRAPLIIVVTVDDGMSACRHVKNTHLAVTVWQKRIHTFLHSTKIISPDGRNHNVLCKKSLSWQHVWQYCWHREECINRKLIFINFYTLNQIFEIARKRIKI